MNDPRPGMKDAIEHSLASLMRIRKCRRIDALHAVASTFRTNARDSIGSDMHSYWQLMLEVTDDLIAGELRVTG